METATTLRDAILWFSEFEHCRQFMTELRWPDGVVKCPTCGATKLSWLVKQRVWKCYAKHPKPTFSLKTGTIFEDSPIPLEKWLCAAWLIMSCKNGISSYEIHRGLKVTQKTAWFMLHRLRLAMQDGYFNVFGGEVEVDETYIGGKARNMHKARKIKVQKEGRNTGGKSVVLGILERAPKGKSKVRASVVPDRTKPVMQEHVRAHVEKGAEIHSDEAGNHWRMDDEYEHKIVNHLEAYVQGNIHTNGMENFWSLLKRGLSGTYISVEPFHLFRYVDEQAFRYNTRNLSDAERFATVMKQIVGRRVTYKELTGKTQEQDIAGMRL